MREPVAALPKAPSATVAECRKGATVRNGQLYGLGAIKAMSDEDVALLQMDAAVATQDA